MLQPAHKIVPPLLLQALPALMIFLPTLFYCISLPIFGFAPIAKHGWIGSDTIPSTNFRFWTVWQLYNFRAFFTGGIAWPIVLHASQSTIPLALVVAFGSSMDIAAIQADVPEELQYDKELITVGTSNLTAAVLGVGFTGSYIFSQTLLLLRQSITSRVAGLIVVLAEFAAFALPISITAFIPRFYLGALMSWIGLDIMKDWLVNAREKVSSTEYLLLLATFGLIVGTTLEVTGGLG